MNTSNKQPRILVVGCGFAGLWAARYLAHSRVDILVLDQNNYHTFLPLLYQVAAAELEPEDIVYPIRTILRRHSNVRFLMSKVTGIDYASRLVKTVEADIPYDFLILAVGSVSHFFGITGADQHAFQLKTLEQAVGLRSHILRCFERALSETEAQKRRQILTFTVVGGGPTGVEFTGALAELVNRPLVKDYPALDFKEEVKILLLEATGRLLTGLPERLHAYALRRLRQQGIQVQLNAAVTRITAQAVTLQNGTVIPTETVVWTAGVGGEALPHSSELPEAHNGRFRVLPTLQIPGHPEVYVAGDLAYIEEDGHSLPMVAPVAIQEAEMAAQNILRQLKGQDPLIFHYRDPGTMATIGRNAAVAQIRGRSFTGFLAWVLWLGVHLFGLIGFRNRLLVMINWAWDYLFYERTVRLILPLPDETPEP